MRHREHDLLGPLEERVERSRDPLGGLGPALAAPGALGLGRVRPRPVAVRGERAALERAEADLVQGREDEALRRSRPERELERLLGPYEPRRDAQADPVAGQRPAQRERLPDPLLGEPFPRGRRADAVGDVGAGVAVTDEQEPNQKSTLR